jgi:hypothetical protein
MAAGYTTSLLLAAQAKLAARLEMPEFKHEPYYLIKLMLDRGQNILTPGTYESYKLSDQRVVYGYAFKYRTQTLGAARSGTHTLAALGDTAQVTISNTIIEGTYGTTLKQGDYNIFTGGEILSHDLLSTSIVINNALEAVIAAYFSTYKSTVCATIPARFGAWDSSNYLVNVPASAEKWFFQYIQECMSINDYDVPLDLVCDNAAWSIFQQASNQGSGNETNTGWQFGNMNIVKSRRVTDTSYGATVYAMPRGTVGMVNRIPKANRVGVNDLLTAKYSRMADPLGTGLDMAVHYYESAFDGSSYGSETQDIKFEYENSTDYGMVLAPMTSGYPILKFVLGS